MSTVATGTPLAVRIWTTAGIALALERTHGYLMIVATPPSPLPSRLLLVAIIALGLTALYFGLIRPNVTSIPKSISDPMAELKPPEPPSIEMPTLEVPPLPTLEPPPLKAVPLIEPSLKATGPAKPADAGDKNRPKP